MALPSLPRAGEADLRFRAGGGDGDLESDLDETEDEGEGEDLRETDREQDVKIVSRWEPGWAT